MDATDRPVTEEPVKRLRANDIVLELKASDDKPKNGLGLVDRRLFTGGNKLHAIIDPQTMLWYLKYDSGAIPEQLKQRFTSFNKLFEFTTNYFKKRSIEIVKIFD